MRKLLWILALVLLLWGCAAEPAVEETTEPVQTETAIPTEPAGCYDPDSAVEAQTGGAVRSYPLPIADAYDMVCVGPDLVIFSGWKNTTLTMLSGENRFISARIELDRYISSDQPSTQVTGRGISYFCSATRDLVLLDTALREVARIAVPGDLVGEPMLSADRKLVYYCTAESVRVLDLETGISRLLTEICYADQTVCGLLLDDTVLSCRLTDENGNEQFLFLSTLDGSILNETRKAIRLSSSGDRYYVCVPEGAMDALIFGSDDQETMSQLLPRDVTAQAWFLESANAVVTASRSEDKTVSLEYYTLSDGLRKSALELENSSIPVCVTTGSGKNAVYLLYYSEEIGGEVVLCWDVETLAIRDSEVYTCPRYTLESPDTAGLAGCEAYAEALGQLYGMEILLCTDATVSQPWDYSLEVEYQVPLIQRELEKLSWLLGVYPEGFLSQASENTSSGVFRVALVRSITGTPESGSVQSAAGIHFWIDEEPYIALAVGQITENVLYHELFHIVESKVLADSQVYYEWDKLNPEGFDYDYNYTDWMDRTDSEYLTGESRAFIDSYSMSFPMEDRARIMEYAMTEGNESCFSSEIMQEKLYQLCLGIRKAFGLTKSEEIYLWEQYLEKPLAYIPK